MVVQSVFLGSALSALLIAAHSIAYVGYGCSAHQLSSNELCLNSSHEVVEHAAKYRSSLKEARSSLWLSHWL